MIARLFKEGQSFFVYPLLVKFSPSDYHLHRVLFSVPKSKIKKAHQRNLIKRRLREAYRLNKAAFDYPSQFDIAYIYLSSEIIAFKEIEAKLKNALKRLSTNKLNH